MRPRIFLPFLILASLHCALMYSDRGKWLNPAFIPHTGKHGAFAEVLMSYESRASWVPWNTTAVSRNYQTTIWMTPLRATGAKPQLGERYALAQYDGWTLNTSLYAAHSALSQGDADFLVALRGTDDSPGGEQREVVFIPLTASVEDAALPVDPSFTHQAAAGEYLLAAIPAPGQPVIAVFLTRSTLDDREGKLLLDFRELNDHGTESIRRLEIDWEGDPGMPDVAWSRDGRRIFLKLYRNIVVVELNAGGARPARSFPQCFYPTASGKDISDDGWQLLRGGYDPGEPEAVRYNLARVDGWRSFEKVAMISDVDQIGYGCR